MTIVEDPRTTTMQAIMVLLAFAIMVLLLHMSGFFDVIAALLTPHVPAPNEVVAIYANGTALLGNGTLINFTGMELR
jgi:hypothetical protein